MNPVAELKMNLDQQGLWSTEVDLDRNQYLKVQGSSDTKLYWVVEGSLRIFVVDENEEPLDLAIRAISLLRWILF